MPQNNIHVGFVAVAAGGFVLDNAGYGLVVGPSTKVLSMMFHMATAAGAPHAFGMPYPAPRQLSDQLTALVERLKQAYKDRKAPFTWPGHWITNGTANAAQNARWIQMADQVILDAGATLINFANLPPAAAGPAPADQVLIDRARHY